MEDSIWGNAGETTPTYKYVKGGPRPEPVVKYTFNGQTETLKNGTDYTLKWSNNSKPGRYDARKGKKSIAPAVTVSFKGRFSGKTSRTFTILPGEFAAEGLSASDVAYKDKKTGLHLKTVLTLKDSGGKTLKAGTDYYGTGDRKKPAEFKFVSFNGNETGTVKIKKGGKWIEVNVKRDDEVKKGYSIHAGTKIKVTVHGKGCYDGQIISAFFYIAPTDFSKASVSIPAQAYKGRPYTADEIGRAMTVTLGGKELEYGEGKDFTISYLEARAGAGKAGVTLKGSRLRAMRGRRRPPSPSPPGRWTRSCAMTPTRGGKDRGFIRRCLQKER